MPSVSPSMKAKMAYFYPSVATDRGYATGGKKSGMPPWGVMIDEVVTDLFEWSYRLMISKQLVRIDCGLNGH